MVDTHLEQSKQKIKFDSIHEALEENEIEQDGANANLKAKSRAFILQQ